MTTSVRIHRPGGFTLVEMVVVLVIVGLLMTAAVSAVNRTPMRTRLRNQACEILEGLRYCQRAAHSKSSLGSGIEYRVNFYNTHEFGLERFDTADPAPVGTQPDPGARVAQETGGMGEHKRLGDTSNPINQVGSPVNPEFDRVYFTRAGGPIRVPDGSPGDRVVFRGRSGLPILPWTGPRSNPTVFDRIVITNSPTLPPPAGYKRFVLRLASPTGNGVPVTPWMEISLNDVERVP